MLCEGGILSAIRIMIMDNNAEHVETLTTAFDNRHDYEIVSVVATREEALKTLSTHPDLVILNPEILMNRTLLRFIHSIAAKSPSTRVICTSEKRPSDEIAVNAVKSGARGYFSISDRPEMLRKAVKAVHAGEIWVERKILEKTIARPMHVPKTLLANSPGLPPLTKREIEILGLVLKGAANGEIADTLGLSERTVKTHLYHVYRKLKVKNRAKAIAMLSE